MPVNSPTDISDATLGLTIKLNGALLRNDYPVISMVIQHEINRISFAEICIMEDSKGDSDFEISDSNDLTPGNKIEIIDGHGSDKEVTIFEGLIVKQGLRIRAGEPFTVVITCKHSASRLCYNRIEEQFSNRTDSEIIEHILENNNLSASVDSTRFVSPVIFQKLVSDWDFILSRADFNGFVISTEGDRLIIGKPTLDGLPVLRVVFGESILSFEAELSAENQLPSLQVSGWDFKNQSSLTSTAQEPALNKQGNLTAKSLSTKLGQKMQYLTSCKPLSEDYLKVWGDSELLKMRLSALKGTVRFIGNGLVRPNTIIEIAGIGERYSGNAYISKVSHLVENGEWTTEVKFGLDSKHTLKNNDISDEAEQARLPSIKGLQVGKVKQLYNDPDAQFRILVNLQNSAENQEGIWARMANFYGTNHAGSGFLPEIDDEVVLGFLENDLEYPIILGSLYSSSQPAVSIPSDNNNYVKSIITKSKLKIAFDDENKTLRFETPEGNMITLSDDAKSIELVDHNSNSIKLNAEGVFIQSTKDIVFKAQGGIQIDALTNIELASQMDVKTHGLNIKHDAQIAYSAKGSASAELSAAGQTIVKGAIVMIN